MVITPRAVFAAVADVMGRPWEWGQVDCCTAACDVFARLYGFDPMGVARGAYRTEAGAYRYIMKRGGFEATVSWLLTPQGFSKTDAPQPGDLALCQQNGPFGAALGICIQSGEWAAKTETGHAILTTSQGNYTCRQL